MDSLNDIIVKISAIVSQTTDVTNTSDEYGLWRSYINMAQKEWAETYDWPSLYKEYNGLTTALGTSAQAATITLPADFRKLAGFPKITHSAATSDEYGQIDPEQKTRMASDAYYCFLLKDGGSNYLVVSPGTLSSGASVYVPYWRSPASLCSPTDIIDCPNPDYLVSRVIALIWESREDARFPQAKVEADKILARLLESEMAQGYAYDQRITTPEERRSFRIGIS